MEQLAKRLAEEIRKTYNLSVLDNEVLECIRDMRPGHDRLIDDGRTEVTIFMTQGGDYVIATDAIFIPGKE